MKTKDKINLKRTTKTDKIKTKSNKQNKAKNKRLGKFKNYMKKSCERVEKEEKIK